MVDRDGRAVTGKGNREDLKLFRSTFSVNDFKNLHTTKKMENHLMNLSKMAVLRIQL